MYARVRPRCRVQLGSRGAPRAKEEIVHPASFVDPSTPSAQLRSTLSVPGLLIQLPSQILLCQRGVGGGYYRHGALQPPLRSAHRPALAGALMFPSLRLSTSSPDPASLPGKLHANSAQALLLLRKPADPDGSWFSGRGLPPNHQPPGRSSSGGLRPTLRGYGCSLSLVMRNQGAARSSHAPCFPAATGIAPGIRAGGGNLANPHNA